MNMLLQLQDCIHYSHFPEKEDHICVWEINKPTAVFTHYIIFTLYQGVYGRGEGVRDQDKLG